MKFHTKLLGKALSLLSFDAKLKIAELLELKLLDQQFMERITYSEAGLITCHGCDFVNDQKFLKAHQKSIETGSWPTEKYRWKIFNCCWVAERAMDLQGDFVECGVALGGVSRAVIDFVGFESLKDRIFYLMDTYEGLVEELLTDVEKANGKKGGGYEPSYQRVVDTFAEFENVKIIRGAIPGTLPAVQSPKIAYLHIDMNCVVPEIAAIEYFWDRLAPGAIVVLDDYGWKGFEEQRKAFDRFAYSHGTRVLPLPTAQGFLMKPPN